MAVPEIPGLVVRTRVGTPPPEPTRPHQRWHTDIMYLRVEDTWYFLVTVLDAYSRYVVHWDSLPSMTSDAVSLVVAEAAQRTGAHPEVVTDNGSQFTAKDFKELVRTFGLEHIRIRVHHPESNGKLERFHRSTRDALDEVVLQNLGRARELIGHWVKHYNTERLHAALNYLPLSNITRVIQRRAWRNDNASSRRPGSSGASGTRSG